MYPDLRFPIGPAPALPSLTPAEIKRDLQALRDAPALLAQAAQGLSPAQLDTPYRPDGWTVRQLVHHVADSHLNAYVRCKLVLTEPEVVAQPWSPERWAAQPDAELDVEVSLALLGGLHARWTALLEALDSDGWSRFFVHPELSASSMAEPSEEGAPWRRAFGADDQGRVRLDQMLSTYAWHGQHHAAHISSLRTRRGW